MKTISTLLLATFTTIFSHSSKAQFSENFETNNMVSNCWNLFQVHHTVEGNVDPINGTGSLYTNPLNGANSKYFETPYLNITSTSLSITFNYKLTSAITGEATRTIEVGLEDNNENFTVLQTILLDENSPITMQSFSQAFSLSSTGIRRVVFKVSGSQGGGNSRLVFDDLTISANTLYGPGGNCNAAPIAVNDAYNAMIGAVVTGNVMTNDNEPNGEAMTAAVVVTSLNGTLVMNANGSFIFTPNFGFMGPSTSFTYQLTDQGYDPLVSNIATVVINFIASSPLPVSLMNFDAKYIKPNVQLNWSTAQEKNFSHFVIERSTDGSVYDQTAMVFGAGESETKQDYAYTDNNLGGVSGLVYYRLKSVDIDGKITFSSVRIIRIGAENPGIKITTFPNPVASELRITIPSSWQGKTVVYEVYGMNGQVVNTRTNTQGSQTETISMINMPRGLYIVKATCGSEFAQQKIVKQ
jgi:hypothetical protein